MHRSIRLTPITIDKFFAGLTAQISNAVGDIFKCPRIWSKKRENVMRCFFSAYPIDFLNNVFISAISECNIIISRRQTCFHLLVQKNSYILVYLREITIPAKPAVFTWIHSTKHRSRCRHCRRRKCRTIYRFQMTLKETFLIQIPVNYTFSHAI